MPETNILVEALDARWSRLRKEWDRTRHKYSDDAIHDLRVACRRLLAVLDTLGSLEDDPDIEECRRRVKKSLGALSPIRDVQVQREYIAKMADDFAQLKGFQKSLKEREERIAKKLQKRLRKGPRLARAMAKARKHARDNSDDKAIVAVVDQRFGDVVGMAKRIDSKDSKTLHQTRLAFKRFRYSAEVVQPLVKKELTDERLEELHSFQTMMGDIQDVEVLSKRLSKWARKSEERLEEMQPVVQELERRKHQHVEKFLDSVAQVYAFWPLTRAKAKLAAPQAQPASQ